MSEKTKSGSQRGIIVLLSVIAVLLAALVIAMIVMFSGTLGSSGSTTSTGTTSSAQTVAFDPATATKVPAGMAPKQLVEAYYNAVINGKYEDAYKLLPLGSQLGYGSASAFAAQMKDYGVTTSSFKLGGFEETADTYAIAAAQVMPDSLTIAYTWYFKKVGDQWYAESRAMMSGTDSSTAATSTAK
ncbi:MAG: hypothetical protein HGA39_02810 [Coriobacteriia bacterium]|nr:hypothetical protein [Coriobacteriia bacterium]